MRRVALGGWVFFATTGGCTPQTPVIAGGTDDENTASVTTDDGTIDTSETTVPPPESTDEPEPPGPQGRLPPIVPPVEWCGDAQVTGSEQCDAGADNGKTLAIVVIADLSEDTPIDANAFDVDDPEATSDLILEIPDPWSGARFWVSFKRTLATPNSSWDYFVLVPPNAIVPPASTAYGLVGNGTLDFVDERMSNSLAAVTANWSIAGPAQVQVRFSGPSGETPLVSTRSVKGPTTIHSATAVRQPCTSDCTLTGCGDGYVGGQELCEPSLQSGCTETCVPLPVD